MQDDQFKKKKKTQQKPINHDLSLCRKTFGLSGRKHVFFLNWK